MTDLNDTTTEQLAERLVLSMCDLGRIGIAFSGGVDSAVIAKAGQLAVGDDAVAFTAVSPSLAGGELEICRSLADRIGIEHRIVRTEELARSGYVANGPDRCYHCKSELYGQLLDFAPQLGIDVLINGANADDAGDHRPGMRAALEFDVRSPLLELGIQKPEVRALAKFWSLPVWNKPATPCLSSRIAYGIEVTPERLAMIDAAENVLKRLTNANELRVRYEADDLARVELPIPQFPKVMSAEIRDRIVTEFRSIGFRAVTLDLEGFRSGSGNRVLVPAELERFDQPRPGTGNA